MRQEVSKLRDKTISVVEKTNETLRENVIKSGDRLKEIIEETEEIKGQVNREVKKYFERHKIMDYLVYANLVITPILFLIIVYILFFR